MRDLTLEETEAKEEPLQNILKNGPQVQVTKPWEYSKAQFTRTSFHLKMQRYHFVFSSHLHGNDEEDPGKKIRPNN